MELMSLYYLRAGARSAQNQPIYKLLTTPYRGSKYKKNTSHPLNETQARKHVRKSMPSNGSLFTNQKQNGTHRQNQLETLKLYRNYIELFSRYINNNVTKDTYGYDR